MANNTPTCCTACSEESVRHKPIPKSDKAKKKVATVMGEFKAGDLKSSSGKTVTSPKQAIAISLSEARRAGKKR
jgi:hypothetical protein